MTAAPLHGAERRIVIPEQSADAIAVLRANGFESARIFGNSGGATARDAMGRPTVA